MRKRREFKAGRCYHLISRIANRAFFLDDEEKTRRGYAFMYWNAADWEVIRICTCKRTMTYSMRHIQRGLTLGFLKGIASVLPLSDMWLKNPSVVEEIRV